MKSSENAASLSMKESFLALKRGESFCSFRPFGLIVMPVLCDLVGGWGCCACGGFLLYTVDGSDLQFRETGVWDRVSPWSILFAFTV